MPIGVFSERSGLSPRRLRAYAADGLLVPAAVDASSGYRYYSRSQLRDARLIDALREAGVPLADIRAILRRPSADDLAAWADRVEADAARRHVAIDVARKLLADDAPSASDAPPGPSREEPMTTLTPATRSDTGRVRENNEDAVLCTDALVVVADGMGGAPGGEVASALAVSLLAAAFTGASVDELAASVRAANAAIVLRAGERDDLDGMGTTVCAAGLVGDGRIAVANVGDSRAYRLRDGSLQQLTNDHSLTAELVRNGTLSEQEAATHPHRNVLTRVLGGGPSVDVDAAVHDTRHGDRFLLCTDGLFNELGDGEIADLLAAASDVQAVADDLVGQAVARGGRDNVSVVVADVC